MKIIFYSILCITIFFSCQERKSSNFFSDPATSSTVKITKEYQLNNGTTIKERFTPPTGYNRINALNNSFEKYLQDLPLKPVGTKVKYYNGETKENNNVYIAVVDLPIGNKDLHQCADAVMRLRAEFLWSQKKYEKIHFNFTNGFRVDYSEWIKGRRIVVKGNKTYWNNKSNPSNTYQDFWKYMEQIFMYAGTASLSLELEPLIKQANNQKTPKIGDVIIQGGHPGHAVIIVDQCTHPATGKNLYLLAQSYMPAQEIQVLKNPNNHKLSPWYNLSVEIIRTPEWTFGNNDIKRFPTE